MSAPLVVLIGPSGAGKSSVVKILVDTYGFQLVKTVTTRLPRAEFDTDHTFITAETFEAIQQAGGFFGMIEFFGEQYGLPKFNPEHATLLNLRVPAIEKLSVVFPHAHIVEID